jgi:hypothetical protein
MTPKPLRQCLKCFHDQLFKIPPLHDLLSLSGGRLVQRSYRTTQARRGSKGRRSTL